MTGHEILQSLEALGVPLIMWRPADFDEPDPDAKGPRGREAISWPADALAGRWKATDWKPGTRVGVLLGAEISTGKFLLDFDVDWAPGAMIAARMLPPTGLVFGREGKRPFSHALYTCPEPITSRKYVDPTDNTNLLEIRCAKIDGDVGLQSMVPPSTWSKDGKEEVLEFVKTITAPAHFSTSKEPVDVGDLVACSMIVARHLGHHGFGHEARLAWAGAFLRLGVPLEDLAAMGEAISHYCDNTETKDVRTVLETTEKAMKAGRKAKGMPALALAMGEHGKAVVQTVLKFLGRGQDFHKNADGFPLAENQHNVRLAMDKLGASPVWDDFSERVVLVQDKTESDAAGERPLDDAALEELWLRIDRDFRFRASYDFFARVIRVMAHERTRSPVVEWLETLSWDGVPRISNWLIRLAGAPDTPYVKAVSGIMLVAAVHRARSPGCKYDEMVILESDQGLNKSSALRALCPKDEWFSDDLPLNVDAKQAIERTIGKWIIEAAEMAGKGKVDVEHVKAFLSRQIDGPARMAYARMPVERPRRSIIVGTTNKRAYLSDMTGSRRFWPIEIQAFDLAALKAERDQLWAEAAAWEADGASIRLAEELWPHATAEQEARREIDAWEEDVESFLRTVFAGKDGKKRVTAKQVWASVGMPVERRDRRASLRITEIMQRFGYRSAKVRPPNEDPQSGYAEI